MQKTLEWHSDTSCSLAGVTLQLKPITSEHRNLVLATWIRSAQAKLRKMTCGLSQRTSLDSLPDAVERILDNGNAYGLMSEDGYTVHAWACGRGCFLYYVYVRPEIRGHRIGTEISEKLFGQNLTHAFPWPNRHQPEGWKFDPTLAASVGA